MNCVNLTLVTIPENVREMYSAFWGCTELKSVIMLPYYPPMAHGAFGYVEEGSVNEDLIIHVPEGRVDAYKSANYWCDLADHIYEIVMPTAVDLGLPSGIKWASFNLGASVPEENGDYYAWGENEPYYSSLDPLVWKEGKEAGYDWPSYKWCKGSTFSLTKYCNNSEYGYNGFTDDKTVLDPEDDAAHVNLGGKWRMPTEVEWKELMENCTWTWTTQNGVVGSVVMGTNGNSVFFPLSGYRSSLNLNLVGSRGSYWSSSLTNATWLARYVDITSNDVYRNSNYTRVYGFSVRPVYDDK